jgi:membrane protein implicated in regulation of membrane protease activity
MKRYSGFWWASILLSSVVTGGSSMLLITILTDLPLETAIKISAVLVLSGDIVLALLMEKISPTHILVGPGDRRLKDDGPRELGTVIDDFENGSGSVSIRGESWQAIQAPGCRRRLKAESRVRVLERRGLTLVVESA